jgi:acetylornithine deacetylase/succinyl-diaminopimelate desuccinylase-like protein
MKGGLVCMLYGAAAASEAGLLASGRIVFYFVCDEGDRKRRRYGVLA